MIPIAEGRAFYYINPASGFQAGAGLVWEAGYAASAILRQRSSSARYVCWASLLP